MMRIEITSNAQVALAQLRVIPEAMLKAIAAALDRENELTVGHIQAQHLTGHGPFPVEEHKLGVVTNRLRSSVRPELATIQEGDIKSAIGSNVIYAGPHEGGVDKMVGVRAFTRHDSRGDVFAQGASARFSWRDGKITRVRKAQASASGISNVRAFQRHMRMPARAPIATGMAERAENYSEAISAAILSTWEGRAES